MEVLGIQDIENKLSSIDRSEITPTISKEIDKHCKECKYFEHIINGLKYNCAIYVKDLRYRTGKCLSRDTLLIKLVENNRNMELKDFTTEQLREELKRRAKEARINGGRKKPEYIEVIGVVTKITNSRRSFMYNQYNLDIKDDRIKDCDRFTTYTLKTGKFRKDNYPQVGDTVILKQRITKAMNSFIARYAKIDSIVKHK